jgi:hypothetical protein
VPQQARAALRGEAGGAAWRGSGGADCARFRGAPTNNPVNILKKISFCALSFFRCFGKPA